MDLYNLVHAGFEGVLLEKCGQICLLLWTNEPFVWIHSMHHVSFYMNNIMRHQSDSSSNPRLNMKKHEEAHTFGMQLCRWDWYKMMLLSSISLWIWGFGDFPSAKRQPAEVGEWREDALLGELEPRSRLIRHSPWLHGSPWLNKGGGSSWMTRVAWMVVGSGERLFQPCQGSKLHKK